MAFSIPILCAIDEHADSVYHFVQKGELHMKDIARHRAALALVVRGDHLLLGATVRHTSATTEHVVSMPDTMCAPDQLQREALVALLRDQIGLEVKAAREVAMIEFRNGTHRSVITYVFLVTRWEGEPRASHDIQEPDDGWWHDIHALPHERMLASDAAWLMRVLAGERLMGAIEQSDDGRTVVSTSLMRF